MKNKIENKDMKLATIFTNEERTEFWWVHFENGHIADKSDSFDDYDDCKRDAAENGYLVLGREPRVWGLPKVQKSHEKPVDTTEESRAQVAPNSHTEESHVEELQPEPPTPKEEELRKSRSKRTRDMADTPKNNIDELLRGKVFIYEGDKANKWNVFYPGNTTKSGANRPLDYAINLAQTAKDNRGITQAKRILMIDIDEFNEGELGLVKSLIGQVKGRLPVKTF